ncbi:MAG: hypothetical protein MHM6MM_005225 [Cercozoa sp. M6MM]
MQGFALFWVYYEWGKECRRNSELHTADNDYRSSLLKQAALRLREAGGVALQISTFITEVGDLNPNRPIEARASIFEALNKLCLAHAQEMLIERAVRKGSSETNIARLALGISQKFASAYQSVQEAGNVAPSVDVAFTDFMALRSSVYRAIAYKYLARSASAKVDAGAAVGFAQMGIKTLKEMYVDPEMDHTSMSMVEKSKTKQMVQLRDLYHRAKRDNETIHHEPVKGEEELMRQIPNSVFLAKPVEWQLPKPSNHTFFEREDLIHEEF